MGVSLLVPCPPLARALSLPGVAVPGWAGGLWGADGPRLGVGGLEPLAEGSGGVGGAEALDRVARRAPHAACGMVASRAASLGFPGVRARISLKVCTMCTPSRLPAPSANFTQHRSSCKAGADRQARWAGAWGVGGSELEVLEWREEDVDIRRSRAWQRSGEREQRRRGLQMEDWYGRQGERKALWGSWGEGEVDTGQQWRAWRRLGERERRWRGLGMEDVYGWRGEREAWWGWWGARWTWGGSVARGGARASGSGESGALGGLGGALGSGKGASERLRRGGVVGSVSAGVNVPCGGGGGSWKRRRLRDRASSRGELGQSGGVSGSWGASCGAAWHWEGGGVPRPPWICRVGVRRRRQLVVRVE